jgi:phage N-6-adenine-methyltransferase
VTELVYQQLSFEDARALTDEVKRDAEALWTKLLRLYEGEAHTALGYASWGAYFEEEFGQHRVHGYRLLRAAEVAEALGPSNPGVTEKQARELVPLLDEPERLREAWAEAQERHPEPTAADVRDVVRGKLDVHYSSATPEWATPQDLYDQLDREFGFELDVCATDENAKAPTWYTAKENGLEQPWTGTCWMNPPYGDEIVKWVRKAYESARDGATVVCLVPARTDTGWWWDYARHGEVRFLRGRLKFGGGTTGAPFPSAVVVFGRPADVVWWERAA